MAHERDGQGFVVLDRPACLARLAQRRIAAVAITDGALPLVLPALYTLAGEHVFVAADRDGILGRRLPDNIVSLCVHDLDDELTTGWNVTVTGQAMAVAWSDELASGIALPRWGADPARQIVVRLGTERIAGREIVG